MPLRPPPWRCPPGGTRRGQGRGGAAAFSLIELTIVVMIIAIIAAIAARRLSRHSEQAATNAIAQDMSTLQTAIETYRAEHGGYPEADKVAEQLTKYTDVFGNVSATRTAPYTYGPYVRNIPPLAAGPARGAHKIAATAANDVGWVYNAATGTLTPNVP